MSEIDDFLSQAVTRDKSDLDDVSNEGVRTIAELATAVQKYNNQLADLESQTKAVKENLRKITDEDLPDMLFSLGVKSFKLEDGSEVSVKQTYGAHIKVDNKPEAHQWLRDNGFDDIIKNTVSCEFKRGEDSSANDFMEMASQMGLTPAQKTDVHPMTLKGFVKERIEAGGDFPQELFGVFTGNRATIKRGK
jgi:hypothetical protein